MSSVDRLLGSEDVQETGAGRLSNVAGVVSVDPGDEVASVTARRALLERVCEDVSVQRSRAEDSALETLVTALEIFQAERVLVLKAGAPPTSAELVFALVAWPECAIVHPAESWACAIYLRDSVLPAARACLEAGETDIAALAAAVDVSELGGADLAAISEAG